MIFKQVVKYSQKEIHRHLSKQNNNHNNNREAPDIYTHNSMQTKLFSKITTTAPNIML